MRVSATFAGVFCLGLFASTAFADEAKSCQDRLQVMQTRIEAVPRHMAMPDSKLVQLLPEVPAGKTVALPGPILDIGADQAAMNGVVVPLAKPQPVMDQLAALAEREQAAKAAVSTAYVRIDANQRLASARKLICRVAAQRPIRVVVRDARKGIQPPYRFPPPPPAWREVLDRIDVMADPVERSTALSKAMRVAMGKCPDLRDAFTSLIREPAIIRMVQMSDRLLVAATRCKCEGFDVDGLEAVLLRVLGTTAPQAAYLELEGGCKAWPTKKGLRGQDLAERLAAAAAKAD